MGRAALIGVMIGAGLVCAVASPACAQETVTYTYDALGRVVAVNRSGGPSGTSAGTCNGVATTGICTAYQYDAAGNRTQVAVSNSPNGSGNGAGSGASAVTRLYVTVPLNGFALIVVNQ